MWFKQMTCDCCYTPLESIGRHNKFYFCRILDFQKITKYEYQMRFDYSCTQSEYRINYDTLIYYVDEYVYCYKLEKLTPNNYSTWYCSPKCAVEHATKFNSLLFYFDENAMSVAFFAPHTVEINRAIEKADYTPILVRSLKEENWFKHKSDYKDLRSFGFETKYPQFESKKYKIVKPTENLFTFHKNLFFNPGFQKDFFGSNGEAMRKHVQSIFENINLESYEMDFGRRLAIEWFVTDNFDKYIGFIHITCMHPEFKYKWVVEYGLIEEYRCRGIMKGVLKTIVNWAKDNGCDEIYAISEIFNVASYHVIKSLLYNIEEKTVLMSDEYAGYRPMKNYIVHLL